jgi:hypothetical protein
LRETKHQDERKLDEAIRTARFVRNSCIRYWMDNKGIGRYELSAYCAVLAKEFPWAGKLNSQWLDRLLPNVLGLLLLGFTTTARNERLGP